MPFTNASSPLSVSLEQAKKSITQYLIFFKCRVFLVQPQHDRFINLLFTFLDKKKADREISTKGNLTVSVNFT